MLGSSNSNSGSNIFSLTSSVNNSGANSGSFSGNTSTIGRQLKPASFSFGSLVNNTNNSGASARNNSTLSKDKTLLSEEALELCKCDYCKCYVSVAPVRMVDKRIACGRCHRESEGIRLLLVEALAKQFSFPCCFKKLGCNAVLEWILMDAHEKVCDFKEVQCTITDCDWMGAKSSLKLHFDQKHPNAIINSQKGVKVILSEEKTSNFLYITQNKAFLVFLMNDGERINHQVRFFCTSLEACMYTYDICVYDSEKKLKFLNQKLQSFDDGVGLFNTGLLIEALQSVFAKVDSINMSIQIKCIGNESSKLSVQNIECPVCLEPMLNNVYVGLCGHSFCDKCKRSLRNCPCCRYDFSNNQKSTSNQDIRNYALEGIIKKLSFEL